jgi:hypothetical protein
MVVVFMVLGCASTPQTADEYRRAASGSMVLAVERFEVHRAYNRVANTLEIMLAMCFEADARGDLSHDRDSQPADRQWHPTVIVADAKTEMHVQGVKEQGLAYWGQQPQGGPYVLVLDAFPAGVDKTQIVMYRPRVGYGALISTVKGWVTGEKQACPAE